MRLERAEAIAGLTGDVRLEDFFDEIRERKDLAIKKLKSPTNSRDKDNFYKGGISMAEDILGLIEEAHKTLDALEKEEGNEDSQ